MKNREDWTQLSLFDAPPIKVKNKVRLIELFSGIGAQAKAMERLGVPFETYRAYDIDKYAVMSYNAIHGTNFEPGDITKIHAEDLGIVDRDEYTYILTYSFPCQDLSPVGRREGMRKESNTRSGLLWEVERLLKECEGNLPHILVMENVKQIIGTQNKHDFDMWRESLQEMGYTSEYAILNAKDFGVPQNRERCFMVSWLGGGSYKFPDTIPLVWKPRYLLEKNVENKYFLSAEQLERLHIQDKKHEKKGNGFRFRPIAPGPNGEIISHTILTRDNRYKADDDWICDDSRGVPGIRRLTPRERWMLMDFDLEDFKNASKCVGSTQLVKQAGNSIVVNVLVAIFGQLFEGKEEVYKDK